MDEVGSVVFGGIVFYDDRHFLDLSGSFGGSDSALFVHAILQEKGSVLYLWTYDYKHSMQYDGGVFYRLMRCKYASLDNGSNIKICGAGDRYGNV